MITLIVLNYFAIIRDKKDKMDKKVRNPLKKSSRAYYAQTSKVHVNSYFQNKTGVQGLQGLKGDMGIQGMKGTKGKYTKYTIDSTWFIL